MAFPLWLPLTLTLSPRKAGRGLSSSACARPALTPALPLPAGLGHPQGVGSPRGAEGDGERVG